MKTADDIMKEIESEKAVEKAQEHRVGALAQVAILKILAGVIGECIKAKIEIDEPMADKIMELVHEQMDTTVYEGFRASIEKKEVKFFMDSIERAEQIVLDRLLIKRI